MAAPAAGPARTPAPHAAAPSGGNARRSGSSARRASPASGPVLRWGERQREGLHVSSQTPIIRRWPPCLQHRHAQDRNPRRMPRRIKASSFPLLFLPHPPRTESLVRPGGGRNLSQRTTYATADQMRSARSLVNGHSAAAGYICRADSLVRSGPQSDYSRSALRPGPPQTPRPENLDSGRPPAPNARKRATLPAATLACSAARLRSSAGVSVRSLSASGRARA